MYSDTVFIFNNNKIHHYTTEYVNIKIALSGNTQNTNNNTKYSGEVENLYFKSINWIK